MESLHAAERGDGARPRAPEPLSIVSLINEGLRHWRIFLVVPPVAAALVLVAAKLWPMYEARSAFLPEASALANVSRLAGLAAQFGVNVGATGDQPSADFYVALIKSRDLLAQVATMQFAIASEDGRDTTRQEFMDFARIRGDTRAERVLSAVEVLNGLVDARLNAKAGIVVVEARAPRRELAEQLNRAILELVSEFNLEKRQSRAAAERHFIEDRLTQGEDELNAAENELRAFYEQNRRHHESPRLLFEATRLEEEVARRRQVYNSLAQAYEEARIEEVRNTPVVTLVDVPEGSAEKSGVLRKLILAFLLATLLCVSLMFGSEYLARQRRAFPEEYEQFRSLRNAVLRSAIPAPVLVWWAKRRGRH
jgi:uncharacterized protein involved in exopolysaccharide biosynthesis